MSGSFGDLPRFPGRAIRERERLLDRLPGKPEPPDTAGDQLRHAFPAFLLFVGLGFGLFAAGGLTVVFAVRGVDDGGWLAPTLLLGLFLMLPAVAVGTAVFQKHRYRQARNADRDR